MRLQKYIAKSGITSRRKAEELILKGRVKINNKIIKELGTKVNVNADIVEINGKIIKPEIKKLYIMLNKPKGYVTTLKTEHDDNIVLDLIKDVPERIFPVGRLDKDTTGLLLMTNDGDLTYKLTHPSHNIIKTYIALVNGIPNIRQINRFKKGLKIDGKLTSEANIRIIKKYRDSSILEISIHEGRNRQVRKMCEHIGHPVIELKRTAICKLELGDLRLGEWRQLTPKEINYLKNL